MTYLFDEDFNDFYEDPIDFCEINPDNCVFLMVDMQEKFKDVIHDMDSVVKNASILNKAAEIFNIPLIVTEQSPDKLGETMKDIYLPKKHKLFKKTQFSAITDEVKKYLSELSNPTIILYGIEAHICVLQTVFDVQKWSDNVFLISDATSSRSLHNKNAALNMLNNILFIATTEMLLFSFLKDAEHKNFKDIAKLVK